MMAKGVNKPFEGEGKSRMHPNRLFLCHSHPPFCHSRLLTCHSRADGNLSFSSLPLFCISSFVFDSICQLMIELSYNLYY
jgi:hypothetical protein